MKRVRYTVNAILTLGLISLLIACGTKSHNVQTSKGGEMPALKPAQQAIADRSIETKWTEQGISWKLPADWKRLRVDHDAFNYGSPDNAMLNVNVDAGNVKGSTETILTALQDDALQKQKGGMYQDVRRVAIDGVPGVEFTEAPMKDAQSSRIRQWRGYREDYLGAKQEIIIMLQTSSANFDNHTDEFTAILYSMKITK